MLPVTTPTLVGLIPARSGSKRVRDKNVRPLAGHPVLAYTIAAALESGVCSAVIVSTDSPRYAEIAQHYGAEVPFLRPPAMATDVSPDIEWVEFTLTRLLGEGRRYECFSILRPTSPFRSAETIRRAWAEFLNEAAGVDSLRAVELCQQHPGKMWVVHGRRMVPLLPNGLALSPVEGPALSRVEGPADPPWHSRQYQALPPVYAQNASLEIAWSRVVFEDRSIAGHVLMPFFTKGYEGVDINQPRDWAWAESLIASGDATLPHVGREPYRPES